MRLQQQVFFLCIFVNHIFCFFNHHTPTTTGDICAAIQMALKHKEGSLVDVRLLEVEVEVAGEVGRKEVEGMTKKERVECLARGERRELEEGWYPWYSLQRPLLEKAKFLCLESIVNTVCIFLLFCFALFCFVLFFFVFRYFLPRIKIIILPFQKKKRIK